MPQIGMRELRHNLREYLARVEAGEAFEVTEFGRPVAQLRPVSAGARSMAQLVAQGSVTPATDSDTSVLPPVVAQATGITATDALLAERREDPR